MSEDITVGELKAGIRELRKEINGSIEKFIQKYGEYVAFDDLKLEHVFVVGGKEFPQYGIKWTLRDN